MQRDYKADTIKQYNMSSVMVIFICIDIMLLGVGFYLHFTDIFDMNRLWGVYPLVIALPGLFVSGFNLFYLGLTGVGCIWLSFANIDSIPLAVLVSFLVVGLLGLIAYFIHKAK